MLNLSSTVLQKLAIWNNNQNQVDTNPLMEVHLVNKDDIFYQKGRNLANEVYQQVWGTEKLIDGNNYGIVISYKGQVIGNANLQIRQEHQPIKSEHFFGKEHWKAYVDVPYSRVVEMSSLSIAQDLEADLKQPVMMLLIFSTYTLARSLGITFCATIQRKALHRILTKHLHIPFFPNQKLTEIQGEVPNDKYWNSNETPHLYYLDLTAPETLESLNSCFFYINSLGIQTKFLSRFQEKNSSYAQFRKLATSKAVAY